MLTYINVYACQNTESWTDVRRAVVDANGLQTAFSFAAVPLPGVKEWNRRRIALDELEHDLAKKRPPVRGVVFCDPPFDSRLDVNELLPHRIYLTGRVIRGMNSPPFRLYMLYQLASAALTLHARFTVKLNHQMIHDPPIGCLWDWWKDEREATAAMLIARICPSCRHLLRMQGSVSEEKIAAAQQLLEYVRRTLLGESADVANRIFIAHSEGEDWGTLRKLLVEWGLLVEHFERENNASTHVTERWRQMLNRSRFGFAVLTPDDAMRNRKKRARQNVIHEVGLCHARLGIGNTAILVAEGTETFSNISGLIHISFKSGKLAQKAKEIRGLLEKRGIVEPRPKALKSPEAVRIAKTWLGTLHAEGGMLTYEQINEYLPIPVDPRTLRRALVTGARGTSWKVEAGEHTVSLTLAPDHGRARARVSSAKT